MILKKVKDLLGFKKKVTRQSRTFEKMARHCYQLTERKIHPRCRNKAHAKRDHFKFIFSDRYLQKKKRLPSKQELADAQLIADQLSVESK